MHSHYHNWIEDRTYLTLNMIYTFCSFHCGIGTITIQTVCFIVYIQIPVQIHWRELQIFGNPLKYYRDAYPVTSETSRMSDPEHKLCFNGCSQSSYNNQIESMAKHWPLKKFSSLTANLIFFSNIISENKNIIISYFCDELSLPRPLLIMNQP